MFIVTADQRDSRNSEDLVPAGLAAVARIGGARLEAAADRTAGDELQLATSDAQAVLAIALHLTRLGVWAVGDRHRTGRRRRSPRRCAPGVATPSCTPATPSSARSARRRASRSRATTRRQMPSRWCGSSSNCGSDVHAEGWEVYDLLARGLSQREAAERLGISEGAVSLRAKAAGLRAEEAALPALERVLGHADRAD